MKAKTAIQDLFLGVKFFSWIDANEFCPPVSHRQVILIPQGKAHILHTLHCYLFIVSFSLLRFRRQRGNLR